MHSVVLTRRRVLLGALLLALVLVLGVRFVARAGSPSSGLAVQPVAGSDGQASGSEPVGVSRVVVDVVGAVRQPGVYRLGEGSRVEDAVARAGGATPRADLAAVNLAAPLADGEQVLVPARLPPAVAAAEGALPSGAGPGSGATPDAPVQLSIATVEQLDALPGIGPVTAQKIVDYRTAHGPFRSVDDLDDGPGIGPARVDQLRGLVVP